jgi:tripartite-type tricarboxylate transporter receptor subunit TctC
MVEFEMRGVSIVLMSFAALLAGSAMAAYPDRPIRFVVAAVAGCAPDVNSRLITAEMTPILGQQFVVDNRGGAGGTLGMPIIAKAAPDGYTIGYGNVASMGIAPSVYAKLAYDPVRDFQPIAQISNSYNILAVAPSLAVKSVAELIEYARKNPGKLVYGGATVGSTQYLSGQLFNQMAGTQIKAVSFLGAQVIPAMALGQVHLTFNGSAALDQYLRTGRIRGLAVTGAKRLPGYPELPTLAESGLPGYEVVAWGGIVGPAKLQPAVLAKLNAVANKVLSTPAFLEKYAALGLEATTSTPEQFGAFIRKEITKWAEVARKAGIKPQ